MARPQHATSDGAPPLPAPSPRRRASAILRYRLRRNRQSVSSSNSNSSSTRSSLRPPGSTVPAAGSLAPAPTDSSASPSPTFSWPRFSTPLPPQPPQPQPPPPNVETTAITAPPAAAEPAPSRQPFFRRLATRFFAVSPPASPPQPTPPPTPAPTTATPAAPPAAHKTDQKALQSRSPSLSDRLDFVIDRRLSSRSSSLIPITDSPRRSDAAEPTGTTTATASAANERSITDLPPWPSRSLNLADTAASVKSASDGFSAPPVAMKGSLPGIWRPVSLVDSLGQPDSGIGGNPSLADATALGDKIPDEASAAAAVADERRVMDPPPPRSVIPADAKSSSNDLPALSVEMKQSGASLSPVSPSVSFGQQDSSAGGRPLPADATSNLDNIADAVAAAAEPSVAAALPLVFAPINTHPLTAVIAEKQLLQLSVPTPCFQFGWALREQAAVRAVTAVSPVGYAFGPAARVAANIEAD